jgi:hypothetical protein
MKASPFHAPSVSIELAARCVVARHVRDYQLARWCGVPPHELEEFIMALQDFDENTKYLRRVERMIARQGRGKTADKLLDHTALRQDLAEFAENMRLRAELRPPVISTPRVQHLAPRPPSDQITDPYHTSLEEGMNEEHIE